MLRWRFCVELFLTLSESGLTLEYMACLYLPSFCYSFKKCIRLCLCIGFTSPNDENLGATSSLSFLCDVECTGVYPCDSSPSRVANGTRFLTSRRSFDYKKNNTPL
ncbi:hypothetical protein Hanom_Chr04g00289501 [Helianthus anomalus]